MVPYIIQHCLWLKYFEVGFDEEWLWYIEQQSLSIVIT